MLAPIIYLASLLSVTDGDTFKARINVWDNIDVVTAVRIQGIDTPEMKGKCEKEKVAARAARDRLAQILASGTITITSVSPDKYAGRTDAVVYVGNELVADKLIAEGFARKYSGGTRAGWCG